MITFDNILKTKDECVQATQLLQRIKNIPSIYKYSSHINSESMKLFNKQLGKYFNSNKKVILKQITEPTPTSYYKNGQRIEFSKTGIGYTSEYNRNITPYRTAMNDKNVHCLINDIVLNKRLFTKTKQHLTPEGQNILELIKDIYLKTQPIYDSNGTKIIQEISISNEEKNIFGLTESKYILELTDINTIEIDFENIHQTTAPTYQKRMEFSLTDINPTQNQSFLQFLFIQYHAADYNALLDKYEQITAANIEKWAEFDKLIKEEFAKYLVLEKI